MGIAWNWYYTNSVNPGQLETDNERRAFAVYSGWRSLVRWTGSLYPFFREAGRERAARRQLLALPDHLLRDVGLYRAGTDLGIDTPYRSVPSTSPAPVASSLTSRQDVVSAISRATAGAPSGIDVAKESSRAA